MTEFVTPQLRTVLKTYQDSATKSLQGPGLSLVHHLKKELLSPDLSDESIIAPPPLPPEISQPILSAADTGRGVLYETVLEGKPIGCFLLGGEMRLCIPQILNNVLTDFTLDEINRIIDEQRIFCSTCTPEQLNEFKVAKILPEDVNTSGLITRTNAERLCSALLHRSDRRRHVKGALSFRVYHKCFGKCEGICTPELYSYKEPACIECLECRGMFSPQKFVCHVHKQENSTLHWGFDSTNWRAYLHVHIKEDNREKFTNILDELKERQHQDSVSLLNSHRDIYNLKRKIELDDVPIHHQPCKQEPLDIPVKKAKLIDEAYSNMFDYQQAMLFAQYRHQFAFRPWAPPIGGPKHIPPPHHMPYAAPLPYLSQEPPILQNPERVVRLSECERFERSFQPNVALAPRRNHAINNVTSTPCNNSNNNHINNHHNNNSNNNSNTNSASSNNNNDSNQCRSSSKERDKSRLISTTPDIEIKQERPTTPPEEEDEEVESANVSPELRVSSPTPINNSTPPPPISPEGHSGSNEITSSTSPVPVASHNNISNNNNLIETSIHSPPHTPKPINDTPSHHIRAHHHHHHHHHHHQQPSQMCGVLTTGDTNTIVANSELELSTDTDDDSLIGEPDSSNNSASWDIAVEALKDSRPQDRDKVLQIIKMLVNENAQYSMENVRLVQELRKKDDQIVELIQQQQMLQHNNHQAQLLQPNMTLRSNEPSIDSAPTSADRNPLPSSVKSESEHVIRMPLKKSVRRSPDTGTVVIMPPSTTNHKYRDDAREKIASITRLDAKINNGEMLELVQTADG